MRNRSLLLTASALWLGLLGCSTLFAQSYGGNLDAATCGSIGGWVWDANQPNTPITVDLYDGSLPLATGILANAYRSDLQNAGYGNGNHGFTITTPSSLKNNQTHFIYAKYGSTTLVVPSSPQAVNCQPSSIGYVYDFANLLNPYSSSQWTANGTFSASNGMFTSTDANGGSLILNSTVPGISNSYEVRMVLKLSQGVNGGYYRAYMRGTSNSLIASGNTGTFYAVEVATPTWNGNTCTANLNIWTQSSGTLTQLSGTPISCHDGMIVRAVFLPWSAIIVYVDNRYANWVGNFAQSNGQPGIGVASAPNGTGISAADIGHIDQTPPAAINAQQIAVTAYPDHVDFQFPGVTDDPNGTGVWIYQLLRNGAWAGNSPGPVSGFTDPNVQADTPYTYTLQALDYHEQTSSVVITVRTPPAGSVDIREVGVRPLGSYWGGGGEQIDLFSGNLNYTTPLIKAMARGGWSVGFSLSYNSQNWRQDPAGVWQFGRDVGYGYGWRFQAGSLTPSYQDYFTVHHYVFIDSTGAEYKLDQNNGGVWSSKEGIYVYYDSNAGNLYFRDGSFWGFGSVSAGNEQDAGTMYPTLMQDSNGNQVRLVYNAGIGASWTNSSSRIATIEDVRGAGSTDYSFTYNTDQVPHLTTITNGVGTSESYTFTYSASAALIDPFASQNYGTYQFLQSVKATVPNLTTSFQYSSSGSGEMTQMTTPYGGALQWGYASMPLSGSRNIREVQNRYLLQSSGAAWSSYGLYRDGGDSSRTVHLYANLFDFQGGSNKVWWFQQTATFDIKLAIAYEERNYPNGVALFHQDYNWTTTPTSSNPYMATITTKLDPNQTYQAVKQTTQTVDQYGNLLTQNLYDFGNLSTPARTYTNTYLTDDACANANHPCGSNYAARYIFNRLLSSTLTGGGYTTTLVKNTYDFYCCTDIAGIKEHDPALNTTNYFRGNLATSTTPSGAKTFSYDIGGNTATNQTKGVNTTITTNSTTNWAAPSQITTGTLSSNMGWNSALSLTSASGPNGDSMSINYDSSARPSYSTSPYGATTSYTYNDSATPPNKIATVMGHWAKTSMDGFGRTIKVETGTSTTTVSATDTMYAPCGCSPLAKLTAQSQPYAPGSTTRYWTVYGYDGSGRTVSVSAPDYPYAVNATLSASNGSRSTYVYQGNTVNATDAAGKWKQFRMDAFGNLTVVIEPNPAATAGPPDPTWTAAQVQAAQNSSGVYLYFVTTYTYDFLNHLTAVSMPRPGVTNPQTRSFNYIDPATGNPGALLRSAVNPETGTVSYTYNSDMTLNTKTDNKGQVFSYQYDSLKRVIQINVGGNMLRKFSYDSNPYDGSFSSYTSGRLAAVQNAAFTPGTPNPYQVQFTEMFSYTQAGKVSKKRLQVGEAYAAGYGFNTINLDAGYSYDNEGKMTSVSYPPTYYNGVTTPGPTYTYGFDSMQRPNQLTDQNLSVVVNNVQYGGTNSPNPNALTAISYFGASETRTYNGMGQMTNLSILGYVNMDYSFPAVGSNVDKISSQTDHISVETIAYQYDSLNRLSSAAGSGWTQSFGYDGFGNLVSKTGINSPPLSIAVDPATNRIVGQAYDLNGNQLTANGVSGSLTYDAENRIIQANNVIYGYNSHNKRVWKGTLDGGGGMSAQEVYFYGIDGQKLATYSLTLGATILWDANTESEVFFAGKRVATNGSPFGPDRLGSNGKYFPYGEDRGTALPNDQVKFASYTRDSATGLDYADQRYYANNLGRFMTPDPYQASGGTSDPESWSRYAYTRGDPVNRVDPGGLADYQTTAHCGAACIFLYFVSNPQGGGSQNSDAQLSTGDDPAQAFDIADGTNLSPAELAFLNDPKAVAKATAATAARVTAAGTAAVKALLDNPHCAALFGIGGTSPAAATLLAGILNGSDPNTYFTEAFIAAPNSNLQANAITMATSYSLQNGEVFNTGVNNNVVVAFNFSPSAPFNSGSVIDNAITMLHELGHVYELRFGLGSTALVNDSKQTQGSNYAAASAYNTSLITANCFPGGH